MRSERAAVFAALFIFGLGDPAPAQDVTLTSRDGDVEISGTLLGYDGEFYRLDTIYGALTVDGSGVTCEGPGCPSVDDFVARLSISGSVAMGSVMMPALLEAFAQREGYSVEKAEPGSGTLLYRLRDAQTGKPVAEVLFRRTRSDEGFADLLANEADVVMSSREISPTERVIALQAGLGDMTEGRRARVLALDAVVPVVAPENPVRAISPLDLARAFAGEIDNWTALGGPDAPIALHAPEAISGLGQTAEARILGTVGLTMTREVLRHERAGDIAAAVLADPFALGIIGYSQMGETRPLVLKGPCGRVLRATRRSIKTEDYPLTSPLFLYTPARRLPKVGREFLGFVRGTEAQAVIRRSGYVDQALEEVPPDQQGDRFANAISGAGPEVPLSELQRLVDRLAPLRRLTLSFRFEAGSARLDAQSRSNIERLARQLEQGRFDAARLYFIGFSDGEGPAERNRQIALARAETVRDAVLSAAETFDPELAELAVDAFGEAMPLACDDSAWGRQANRRVEVWLR